MNWKDFWICLLQGAIIMFALVALFIISQVIAIYILWAVTQKLN